MKINSAKIEWYENFGNLPQLVVHVDKMTPHDEVVFRRLIHKRDGAIVQACSLWGQEGDFCTFNTWYGGNTEGYGGRTFSYKLEDGTVAHYKGPWSSNALAMTELGFPPCSEVSVFEDKGEFPNLGYHGWALLYPKFKEVVESLGAKVAYIRSYGGDQEISLTEAQGLNFKCGFTIKRAGMTLAESQKAKQVKHHAKV